MDVETQDEDRHPGLVAFNKNKRHAFDVNRIVMTGFSIYADGDSHSYYVNLAHADVENRVPKEAALELLAARKPGSIWLAHNSPFELMAFGHCLDQTLPDLICTLQMAVSAHGPDEYDQHTFYASNLNCLWKLVPDIQAAFSTFDPEKQNSRSLNGSQQLVMGQFTAKDSKAAHSYNGYVKEMSIGYGLKKLVKSLFGFSMTTYDDLLKKYGVEHMGQLTGAQVVDYGADDAFWAVQVYHALLKRMMTNEPAALVTFFEGEAPMSRVFAEAWTSGLRLNTAEVFVKRGEERARMAGLLRTLKAQVAALLPFPDDLNAKLVEHQAWYAKGGQKKRDQIEVWALSPDSDDDLTQCTQMSNPVGNAWAEEVGMKLPEKRLNISHYYAMRVLLHDLLGHKLVRIGGDITTDKEARGLMRINLEAEGEMDKVDVLISIDTMAGIEQTMKLYLTPYTNLMDPATGRVYPNITSMLATRRMAMSNPNGMQLAKRGEAKFVRGFFQADQEDHVIISADWSAIELVLVGEQSGDPEFKKVFGQAPHGDLHSGAAVDCLNVNADFADVTLEEFMLFKRNENPNGRRLIDFQGNDVSPSDFFKLYRSTEVGKGANFGYWFSGGLGTVAERLGWTTDQMWAAVERYRQRFAVGEEWRVAKIAEVRQNGFITLPDGHRRVRMEATQDWAREMKRKFAALSASPAMLNYADIAIKRIQGRAGNQAVNATIQGMSARLAKDSIIGMSEKMDRKKARFMMPIHDELLYSVHRDYAPEFIPLLRETMCNHPKYVSSLKLVVNVAIGQTFKPYDEKNPAFSQIELDEAPVIMGVIPPELRGTALSDEMVARVVRYVGDAQEQPA